MKRMSSQDAAFLYGETPTWHMHVASLVMLDPTASRGRFSFMAVKALVASRLPLLPQLRWKVVEVPFGVDRPGWIEAVDLDLDQHVVHIVLPSPDRLDDVVSEIVSTKLDRSRPLWQMYVIEGLAHGRAAVVMKVHHSVVDGVAATGVAEVLFDITPDPRPLPDDIVSPIAASAPNRAVLFARGVVRTTMESPRRLARFGVQSVRQGTVATSVVLRRRTRPALPYTAPRVHFNGEFTAHRELGRTTLPVERVTAVKDAVNASNARLASGASLRPCTVNDIVLALCAGVLRRYLLEHDDLPGQPLVVQVPVSRRTPSDRTEVGSKVGSMFAELGVHLADPLDRLRLVRESTTTAKDLTDVIGPLTAVGVTEIVAPGLIGLAARTITALHLERGPVPVNLIVSNVPGPPVQLYLCGAPVDAFFPMGPLLLGMGMNITLLRHHRQVDVGVFACPDLVDRPDRIAEYFGEALDELSVALGVEGGSDRG